MGSFFNNALNCLILNIKCTTQVFFLNKCTEWDKKISYPFNTETDALFEIISNILQFLSAF